MWWKPYFTKSQHETVQRLIDSGQAVPDTQTWRLKVPMQVNAKQIWLHTRIGTSGMNCNFWHHILFKFFRFIPQHCRMMCWKVVCRPRNFKELIRIHNLQWALPYFYDLSSPIPGKAGLDLRESSVEPYAAFWYCKSLEEALEVKSIVKDALKKHWQDYPKVRGKDILDTLIAKKACTEMEAVKPTTDPYWQTYSPADLEFETRMNQIFDVPHDDSSQPFWMWQQTISQWAKHAHGILGDETVAEFYGDHFSTTITTYDENDLAVKTVQGGHENDCYCNEENHAAPDVGAQHPSGTCCGAGEC